MSDIIIYDTEFTAWEGSLERGWSESWEHMEIVQIGAIRIHPETFEESSEPFDVFVQPRINQVLSDYFIDLTSITNEHIKQHSVDYAEAAQQFHDYCSELPCYCFGHDGFVMNENTKLYNLENEIASFHNYDLHLWFEKIDIDLSLIKINNDKVCSGTLAEAVGAPFQTTAHNALNDARSINAAIKYLVQEQNYPSPFTHSIAK